MESLQCSKATNQVNTRKDDAILRVLPHANQGARVTLNFLLPELGYLSQHLSRPALIAVIGFAAAAAALGLTMSLSGESEAPRAVAQPVPPPAASPHEPSFDVVRVDAKGDAVLAGRAVPRTELLLLDGDQELGRTTTDDRGEWVLVPNLPLPPGVHALSLQVHLPVGEVARPSRPVLIVVPEDRTQPPLAVAPLPEGGARLVLAPKGEAGPLSIDLAERDEAGRLFVGGHAAAGMLVQLYLGNSLLGRTRADGDGNWRLMALGAATSGDLRADMADDKAHVRARVEVPLAPPASTAEGVVLEPGAAQWTIARRGTGESLAYTIIYAATKNRVRDPARVLPGQVTHLPKN